MSRVRLVAGLTRLSFVQILNHMVHYLTGTLDLTFAALADATRRSMLARLAERGEMAVGELARPLSISLPGVLKHVNVLVDAGLVVREKRGRTVHCRLVSKARFQHEPGPMQSAAQWLQHYEQFWSERLDALVQLVEHEPCPKTPDQP